MQRGSLKHPRNAVLELRRVSGEPGIDLGAISTEFGVDLMQVERPRRGSGRADVVNDLHDSPGLSVLARLPQSHFVVTYRHRGRSEKPTS